MDESSQIQSLLKEIRDLQQEQIAEYRKHTERSILLTEEGLLRQKASVDLYKKVVFVTAVVIVALGMYLWWIS